MQLSREELYQRAEEHFAPAIARLSCAAERDPVRAEDLQQDIHCALWTSLARYRGECALKTWVYRVAHNVAADHVRKLARSPQQSTLDDIEELPAPFDPEREASRSLLLEQVRMLITKLTPQDSQVILLWLEGETGSEIAAVTGLSENAVSVRVHRIKKLFQRHFTQDFEKDVD